MPHLKPQIPQVVKHFFREILDDLSPACAIEHHDVDVGIGCKFASTISPNSHKATVLHTRRRIAAPLPDHVSIPADQDRINEGGKIRHDFRPGCPLPQSPVDAFASRLEYGLR
jgi:hypothetical protein